MKYSDLNFDIDDVIFHGNTIDDCLFVDWSLLNECNYKCSYCFGQSRLSNAKFVPIEKLLGVVNKIFSIHKSRYAFTITGGEVTYYPYLFQLLDYIFKSNKNVSIYIITNGSRDLEYFENFFSKYSNNNITLTISIHFEYVKYQHIEDIIKTANKYNKRIRLSLMLHPYMHETIKEFYYKLINLRRDYVFDINLAELREGIFFDRVDTRYTDEYFEWVDKEVSIYNSIFNHNDNIPIIKWGPKPYYNFITGNENIRIDHYKAMRENKKKFTGFYCCGGTNTINILPDGRYRAGTCGDFNIIGNIFEEDINYEKLFNFSVCTRYECGCRANDCIPKFRSLEDAIDYTNKIKTRYIFNILYKELNGIISINKNINEVHKNINEVHKNIISMNKNISNFINNLIYTISWWIPVRKWRENFRAKFKMRPDQTRPDQTRPDQTRPDQTRNNM